MQHVDITFLFNYFLNFFALKKLNFKLVIVQNNKQHEDTIS